MKYLDISTNAQVFIFAAAKTDSIDLRVHLGVDTGLDR